MKGLKKSFVRIHIHLYRRYLTFPAQLRKSSQDSSSSKSKDSKSQPAPASAPLPPPPNSTKPLPQLVPVAQSLPGASVNNTTNHSLPAQTQTSYNRAPPPVPAQSSAPDRRYNSNQPPLIPPIVVVNSDPAPDPAPRSGQFGSPERTSLGLDVPGSNATPPRANTLSRLRSGPRDTIPIAGKPPRKQRSSRFVVREQVEIERLAPFSGWFLHLIQSHPPFTLLHQKSLLPKGLNSSLRSLPNVVYYSILMMPVRSSKVNKLKLKLCTKCSSTSPPNAG